MFREDDPPCYDRSGQPQTAVVDTHVHFRPFGDVAIPSEETVSYLKEASVLFCQHLWHRSDAATGVLLHVLLRLPRNARDADVQKRFRQCRQLYSTNASMGVHLTLAMTFPDLSQPESILPGMQLLEKEYPGPSSGWARSIW